MYSDKISVDESCSMVGGTVHDGIISYVETLKNRINESSDCFKNQHVEWRHCDDLPIHNLSDLDDKNTCSASSFSKNQKVYKDRRIHKTLNFQMPHGGTKSHNFKHISSSEYNYNKSDHQMSCEVDCYNYDRLGMGLGLLSRRMKYELFQSSHQPTYEKNKTVHQIYNYNNNTVENDHLKNVYCNQNILESKQHFYSSNFQNQKDEQKFKIYDSYKQNYSPYKYDYDARNELIEHSPAKKKHKSSHESINKKRKRKSSKDVEIKVLKHKKKKKEKLNKNEKHKSSKKIFSNTENGQIKKKKEKIKNSNKHSNTNSKKKHKHKNKKSHKDLKKKKKSKLKSSKYSFSLIKDVSLEKVDESIKDKAQKIIITNDCCSEEISTIASDNDFLPMTFRQTDDTSTITDEFCNNMHNDILDGPKLKALNRIHKNLTKHISASKICSRVRKKFKVDKTQQKVTLNDSIAKSSMNDNLATKSVDELYMLSKGKTDIHNGNEDEHLTSQNLEQNSLLSSPHHSCIIQSKPIIYSKIVDSDIRREDINNLDNKDDDDCDDYNDILLDVSDVDSEFEELNDENNTNIINIESLALVVAKNNDNDCKYQTETSTNDLLMKDETDIILSSKSDNDLTNALKTDENLLSIGMPINSTTTTATINSTSDAFIMDVIDQLLSNVVTYSLKKSSFENNVDTDNNHQLNIGEGNNISEKINNYFSENKNACSEIDLKSVDVLQNYESDIKMNSLSDCDKVDSGSIICLQVVNEILTDLISSLFKSTCSKQSCDETYQQSKCLNRISKDASTEDGDNENVLLKENFDFFNLSSDESAEFSNNLSDTSSLANCKHLETNKFETHETHTANETPIVECNDQKNDINTINNVFIDLTDKANTISFNISSSTNDKWPSIDMTKVRPLSKSFRPSIDVVISDVSKKLISSGTIIKNNDEKEESDDSSSSNEEEEEKKDILINRDDNSTDDHLKFLPEIDADNDELTSKKNKKKHSKKKKDKLKSKEKSKDKKEKKTKKLNKKSAKKLKDNKVKDAKEKIKLKKIKMRARSRSFSVSRTFDEKKGVWREKRIEKKYRMPILTSSEKDALRNAALKAAAKSKDVGKYIQSFRVSIQHLDKKKKVDALTNFCKSLARASSTYGGSDSDEEEERRIMMMSDTEDYVGCPNIYERNATIKMNIKDAYQMPVLSSKDKQIRDMVLKQQFPISTGVMHHERNKGWVPVEKPIKIVSQEEEITKSSTSTTPMISIPTKPLTHAAVAAIQMAYAQNGLIVPTPELPDPNKGPLKAPAVFMKNRTKSYSNEDGTVDEFQRELAEYKALIDQQEAEKRIKMLAVKEGTEKQTQQTNDYGSVEQQVSSQNNEQIKPSILGIRSRILRCLNPPGVQQSYFINPNMPSSKTSMPQINPAHKIIQTSTFETMSQLSTPLEPPPQPPSSLLPTSQSSLPGSSSQPNTKLLMSLMRMQHPNSQLSDASKFAHFNPHGTLMTDALVDVSMTKEQLNNIKNKLKPPTVFQKRTAPEASSHQDVYALSNPISLEQMQVDGAHSEIGRVLLMKMGWRDGLQLGVGSANQGLLKPIEVTMKSDRKGLQTKEEKMCMLPSGQRLNYKGQHPVSYLSIFCIKKRWRQPKFELVEEGGPPHKKYFLFKVEVNGVNYQSTVSSCNKKLARAEAAICCLQALEGS